MTDPASNSFHKLAQTAQAIVETRSAKAKISICADYLRSIPDEDDLNRAARFLGEGAFSAVSGRRISIGSRTISTCAAEFCDISYEYVFKPSKKALGSASETIEKLMRNLESARTKRRPKALTLAQIEDIFEKLFLVTSQSDKRKILWDTWSDMTPLEIKYFIRILGRVSLKIGFTPRSLVSAIAEAFDRETSLVRDAYMITGSLGKTTMLAKSDRLNDAAFRIFHPLSFMRASPLSDLRDLEQLQPYVAEEKFDGIRCQIHIGEGRISLFSRDMNDITPSFPDLVRFFLKPKLPTVVLDGEICVFREDEILPLQLLQKRMGLKNPSEKMLKKFPVVFVAYDVLYVENQPVFDKILSERRDILLSLAESFNLTVTNQFCFSNHEELEYLYERAVKRGNVGLVLKDIQSKYEYGNRGRSWMKVKKPGGFLNAVIMYAHAESGKRGSFCLDFTLGIRVKEDDRYEEEFIPIGKACGNRDDEKVMILNERLDDLTVEKYGPTLGLIPEIVVEVEFDDILVNKRTKANFTLNQPRIKAIRRDLTPEDADTLKDVESIFEQKVNRNRLKQDENPSLLNFTRCGA